MGSLRRWAPIARIDARGSCRDTVRRQPDALSWPITMSKGLASRRLHSNQIRICQHLKLCHALTCMFDVAPLGHFPHVGNAASPPEDWQLSVMILTLDSKGGEGPMNLLC